MAKRLGRALQLASAALAVPIFAALAAVAQTEPSARVDFSAVSITLGDSLKGEIRVTHPPGWRVLWPDTLAAAPFEVLLYEPAPQAEGEEPPVQSAALLSLTAFERLGALEVPSFRIPLEGPEGAVDTVGTNPFAVGVVSVGLDSAGNLRDIKGPLELPRRWQPVILWGLAAALLIVLGGILYHLRARRTAPDAPVVKGPAAPPKPSGQAALDALDELEAARLIERGLLKEYHVRISEIIRAYIEGQLRVPAMELTTREVLDGLSRAALGRELTMEFGDFLECCDLVKFAKHKPSPRAALSLLPAARELVARTSGGAKEDGEDGDEEEDR